MGKFVECSQDGVLWLDLQPPENEDRYHLCKSAKGPFTGDPATVALVVPDPILPSEYDQCDAHDILLSIYKPKRHNAEMLYIKHFHKNVAVIEKSSTSVFRSLEQSILQLLMHLA